MRTTVRTTRLLIPFGLALVLLAMCNGVIVGRASPARVAPSRAGSSVRLLATPVVSDGARLETAPMEPDLLRALSEASADGPVRVIVHLRDQADLASAVGDDGPGAIETRLRIVAALQETARRTQAPLRAFLAQARATGAVEHYTPFWIVNAIAVRAPPSTIRALAARPEVSAVRLDRYRQWLPAEILGAGPAAPNAQSVEWGISQIRADEVWSALHISGTGAVVAGMDTGVDWNHPALQTNYRGYNPPGPANHAYSWYDATDGGNAEPADGHGHGTHTMGTMVGRDGIGVAPGARWIAVKVFDDGGGAQDAWFHASFQWLLAPGGDPGLAPDVVNCSWGNADGYLTEFQPDLQALRAAGILPVFSNGNNGPVGGTVGSPASLAEAFAVGATDSYDLVANFSSRGPSPWGEVRPHVAAPGVGVRSSLPGGGYGQMSGTSMAAPHVSGIAALLHSVSSTLSITRTAFVITGTAVPLGTPVPNNDTGYGRVDALAAVASVAHPGFIAGTVTRSGSGAPISGAQVRAIPHSGGGGGVISTDNDGTYVLALAPTTYSVTASAFGYVSATVTAVGVLTDSTAVANLSLNPLPTGTLRGCITDVVSGDPVIASVAVLDTPVEATASSYILTLPVGDYTVRARSLGYRVVTAAVQITAGQVSIANFALSPAPTILLVDSGRWYNDSQAGYFRQALDDLAYAYDEWLICRVPGDVPAASDLSTYDVVVWSSPQDSPGLIGAEDTVTGYLAGGGRLFLSGQDVGYFDDYVDRRPYYRDDLKARLAQDSAGVWVLEGEPHDLLAGLTITIAGSGGADNQYSPDEIDVLDPDAAAPVLTYRGNGCGGLRAGICLSYRAVYLSFGFEAINDRESRREVMDRTLGWLAADPPTAGLKLKPDLDIRVAPPGTTITYTVRVRHVGEGGGADTVSLTLGTTSWLSQVEPVSFTLAPCADANVVVTVTVPPTATWHAQDVATLTARSSLSPTLLQTVSLTTKAPAPVLLVDDDLFFEQRQKYEAALDAAAIPYDFWQTCPAIGWCVESSPPLTRLQWYPIVVWWTGYDWHRPVRTDQAATLRAYLDGGGRLFLSSQDYLYYHHGDSLSRDHLGVLNYVEAVTPTLARRVPGDPISTSLGPYSLTYPFGNSSDGMEPGPGTAVALRDQNRQGIALARRDGSRATAFFSFPFEALPEAVRPEVMQRVVGWLSWLGGSSFGADRGAVSAGGVLTYAAALRNDGPATVTASLSNTLPVSLTMVPGSLTGPAVYLTPTRRVTWQGDLAPGNAVTITYRVAVTAGLPALTPITNTALLRLEDQHIRFHRASVVRVGAPDLAPSILRCDSVHAPTDGVVTCTLSLANAGPADATVATITNSLPSAAALVTTSLSLEGGGVLEALTSTLRWTGPLTAGVPVTVVYRLVLPTNPAQQPSYNVVFLEDGVGGAWERAAWPYVEPLRYYLPVFFRKHGP